VLVLWVITMCLCLLLLVLLCVLVVLMISFVGFALVWVCCLRFSYIAVVVVFIYCLGCEGVCGRGVIVLCGFDVMGDACDCFGCLSVVYCYIKCCWCWLVRVGCIATSILCGCSVVFGWLGVFVWVVLSY